MKKITKDEKIAYRVSVISIIINIFLSIFKFIAGVIGNSKAMISDAVHSLSDVLSTFIVMIGIRLSKKEADKKHPYGHDRFECVASIFLAAILLVTGMAIGYDGIKRIVTGNYKMLKVPSLIALIAALISIIVKELMYQYTKRSAKKINSSALLADAWHHRSDALSSIGSLIGIFGSMLGFKMLDSIASVAISLCIIKSAIDILRDSIDKMLDCAASETIEKEIIKIASNQEGVMGIDDLKTRQFGSKIYIDIEISVDGKMELNSAHKIAHLVHDQIEDHFKECKHCMVHVNPYLK